MALELTFLLLGIFGCKLDKFAIQIKMLHRYYLCRENIDTSSKCKEMLYFNLKLFTFVNIRLI